MTDANNRISRYLDLSNPIPEMQSNVPQIPAAVTAIAGIPYQWNGAWNFADNNNPGVFQTNKWGFMPRAGLAFKVNDKTVLRAGYARYVIPVGMTQPFQSSMPIYGYTASTTIAPTLQGIPGGQLSDPFPATNPLILPTGASLGRYQNLGAAANFEAQDFKTGVSDRMNLSVQRQLPLHFNMDVTYFLNLGHNLPYTLQLNQMDPQLSYTNKGLLDQTRGEPVLSVPDSDHVPRPVAQPEDRDRRQPAESLSAVRGPRTVEHPGRGRPLPGAADAHTAAVHQRPQLPVDLQLQPRADAELLQRS